MLNGESLNITQDNLSQLQALFPNVFTEGKIDFEKFKATFSNDINFNNERYVLNWAGKADAFKVLQIPTTATLKPQFKESINFNTTENIFIEGENLEVLKVLQKSYYNKVKCIIIDPPYNTGSDSFIYPDNFKENKADYEKRIGDKDEEGFLMKEGLFRKNSKDSGHYHSNWLSMMYPRLFLAKNLLKDDGVIFVHIDDNEVHNLRLLMNEVFGEENFVANIIWERAFAPVNLKKHFSESHDYIICVAKKIELLNSKGLIRKEDDSRYKNLDNDSRGLWTSSDMTVGPVIANKVYEITTPSGKKILPTNGRCWLYTKERFLEMLADNRIWFGESGNNTPRVKKFLDEVKEGITPMTIWKYDDVGHSQDAAQKLKSLFNGNDFFDYPKSVPLIKRMIQLYCNHDDIILDFFAGSGTTAQAVIELNKEDSSNRKFILVQLPELCNADSEAYKAGYKTIADISQERIRRVIKKLNTQIEEEEKKKAGELALEQAKTTKPKSQIDLGFKSFKLSQSNFKIWQGNDITADNLVTQLDAFANPAKEESLPQNMLYELILKAGYSLTERIEEINVLWDGDNEGGRYNLNIIANGELIILLENISYAAIEDILERKPQKVIALDSLFKGNDQLKTNTVLQMKDAGIDFKTI
ncbi:MAG: site-specific DNA-methyltransferase [Pedobacter sp.]|nr:site-specific DNA-methyltransferase [Chitinophagaceae bacterium]